VALCCSPFSFLNFLYNVHCCGLVAGTAE
jgi:hypothetical protein